MITDIGSIKAADGSILLKMWEVMIEPGDRPFRNHSHLRFEISKVLSGSGIYMSGNKIYRIEKGSMLVFAGNEQHCARHIDGGGLNMLNIQFEPRYLWGKDSDSLSEQNIGLCFSHSDSFRNHIDGRSAAYLSDIMEKIRLEISLKSPEYPLAVKSYLNMMLISLIRDHGYSPATESVSKDKSKPVRDVIKYIDAHYPEQLELQSLASAAGLSPNYFSALFYSVSGIHLWDYVNSRRIDAAIRLLADNELNILDIAVKCGFNNTANFNKTFKKITGLTPTEYRHSDEYI